MENLIQELEKFNDDMMETIELTDDKEKPLLLQIYRPLSDVQIFRYSRIIIQSPSACPNYGMDFTVELNICQTNLSSRVIYL